MLIQSLKTHFPARALEWFMALQAFSWGFYATTHPQIFVQPATAEMMSGLAKVAGVFGQPPAFIALMALLIGLVRGCALFVNGAVTKTPLIRLITAFASMYLFTSISIGLWLSNVDNTGIAIYPFFVLADVISAYRAGYDVVIAENTARQAKANDKQRGSSGRTSILARLLG